MPTMRHPETGATFECPDRQVDTWVSAGWELVDPAESAAAADTSLSIDPNSAPPTGDDNTEE